MSLLIARALRLVLPDGSCLLDTTDLVLDQRVTAVVGANGCGKSTLCRVLAGDAEPAAGHVNAPAGVARVAAAELDDADGRVGDWLALHAGERVLPRWLAQLGLSALDWQRPLSSLSGGERTRLALAAALATGAGCLILDEPGTHLDRDAGAWLADFLRRCRSGVLLISHDAELLATASRVLELSSRQLHDYALDFDGYRRARATEQAAARRAVDSARRDLARTRVQAQLAHERAERRAAQGRRGRRGGDHGAMYYDFVGNRAEAGNGRRESAARQREQAALAAVDRQRDRLRLEHGFDLRLHGRGPPAGRRLLHARGLAACVDGRTLFRDLDVEVVGAARIAIVGANGSGKSRLMHMLAGHAACEIGVITRAVSPVLIDQHAQPPAPQADLVGNLQAVQPDCSEARARERLAWFGFRGDRAQQPAARLSRGERLRLLLCLHLGAAAVPPLLLLDEPDNHLDMQSLAIVEHALRQYPGALLVVSHSDGFLDTIGVQRRIDLDAQAGATNHTRSIRPPCTS